MFGFCLISIPHLKILRFSTFILCSILDWRNAAEVAETPAQWLRARAAGVAAQVHQASWRPVSRGGGEGAGVVRQLLPARARVRGWRVWMAWNPLILPFHNTAQTPLILWFLFPSLTRKSTVRGSVGRGRQSRLPSVDFLTSRRHHRDYCGRSACRYQSSSLAGYRVSQRWWRASRHRHERWWTWRRPIRRPPRALRRDPPALPRISLSSGERESPLSRHIEIPKFKNSYYFVRFRFLCHLGVKITSHIYFYSRSWCRIQFLMLAILEIEFTDYWFTRCVYVMHTSTWCIVQCVSYSYSL